MYAAFRRAPLLTIVVLLENLFGVLFGLCGGVGVVQVSLVAADDLSFRSHVCSVSLSRRYLGSMGMGYWGPKSSLDLRWSNLVQMSSIGERVERRR
jgi:hypothetical protein